MAYHKRLTHQIGGNTAGVTANISTGSYFLAGGNNITLSQNANSVTISAGGGGGIALANSQTTYSTGTAHLSGAGAITIASTTGQSYQFSVPNTSQISATGLLSVATNGQTISIGAASLGAYAVSNTTQSSSGTVDGRSISFHGAGIASVGVSNGSVVISVPPGGGAGDGVNILAAGTQTAATTGTVLFNNANGVTFGMANSSVITASHNGLTSQSNQALSAANGSFTFQTATFANSNGVSFSTGTQGIFATVRTDYLTSQSNQAISGSNGSFAFQTVTFGNDNGLSFYTSNGSMVGSYTVPTQTNQTIGIYHSSQTTGQSSSSTFDARSITFRGAGIISVGNSAGEVIISATGGGAADGGIGISAGANSLSAGTVVFSNSNGVSFGLNGSTVTASHNGITSQTNQTLGGYFVGNTTGQSSSSTWDARTLSIDGAGIVSAGWSNGTMRISATQSNQALSGSNGSFTFQTATFGNSNGISFLTSNGSMIASYTVPTVTNSSWTVSDNGTSGSVARLAFTNLNGVTLSLSTGAGGSHTIVGSHNGLTSQSNQAASAANGSFAFQTISFSNLNGISFGTSAGSAITASHNGLTTARASNDAIGLNTAQSNVTWTVNSSGLSFDARGYAGTGTSATNASITLNSNGLAISVGAGGGVTPVASASNGSFSFTTLAFSNANNVTFGTSAGSIITASVAAPGAAAENNWINLSGNTAGNTTASGSTVNFSGINITLSGTNGSQIAFSVPATSSIIATGAVSVSTNGSTISIGAPPHFTVSQFPLYPMDRASSSAYSGATTTVAGGSQTTMSIYLSPFVINDYVSFNKIIGNLSHATVAGTGSLTNAQLWGLYTRNGNTLNSVSTWAFNILLSQNSVTARSHYWYWGTNSTSNSSSNGGNISASIAKQNAYFLYDGATSITPGNYWLAYAQTMRTSGAAVGSFSHYHASMSQTTQGSLFGTNVSSMIYPLNGIVSTLVTSNASLAYIMPSTINTTAVTGTGGSTQNRFNFLEFVSL